MSEENVEIVRAMFEPFNGMDIADIDWGGKAMREIIERRYSPEVKLTTMESAIGIGPSRSYSGWEGLVRYLDEWFGPFSEYHLESLDFIDVGDRVIVPSRARGVGGASGIHVDMELTISYEFRDGLITRVDQYDTVEDALEAAGLSE
jgi:ketosteroid isomerase-like protein